MFRRYLTQYVGEEELERTVESHGAEGRGGGDEDKHSKSETTSQLLEMMV